MLRRRKAGNISDVAASYDRCVALAISLLVAATCAAVLPPVLLGAKANETLTLYFAFQEDSLLVAPFLFLMLLRPRPADPGSSQWLRNSPLLLGLTLVVIILVSWAGHHWVFQGYDFSRDEQLAVFDQGILAQGKLFWPIGLEWRYLVDALNERYLLPIPGDEIWVSGYLPVHAGFRALISQFIDPAFSSPILAALAAALLWAVARKIWPHSQITAVVALTLLVTSSQFLITAMTAFSMTMHLALNLLWLTLFLKDRWLTHLLAVSVGFLATGIHQPLFHPLFVLPFLFWLFTQRRWPLLTFYLVAYGAVAIFWTWWPLWISSHGTVSAVTDCASQNCTPGVGIVDRLLGMLQDGPTVQQYVSFTGENLLRFVLWQHPMTLPLALLGAMACWGRDPLARTLAIGVLLPIVVIAILLPWQGTGWGYRYLHPVLGNVILLACYGYERLQSGGQSIRRALVLTTTAALVLLALHAWMASRLISPFVQIREELEATSAHAVIVDSWDVPFAEDVVFNRFDLANRPILLLAHLVEPQDVRRLCKRATIAFYEAPRFAPAAKLFGSPIPKTPSPTARALMEVAEDVDCRVVSIGAQP